LCKSILLLIQFYHGSGNFFLEVGSSQKVLYFILLLLTKSGFYLVDKTAGKILSASNMRFKMISNFSTLWFYLYFTPVNVLKQNRLKNVSLKKGWGDFLERYFFKSQTFIITVII